MELLEQNSALHIPRGQEQALGIGSRHDILVIIETFFGQGLNIYLAFALYALLVASLKCEIKELPICFFSYKKYAYTLKLVYLIIHLFLAINQKKNS